MPYNDDVELKNQDLMPLKKTEPSKFSQAIKKARKEKNISLRELGEKTGNNFAYLSRVENGDFPPPGNEIIGKLAEVLDIDRDYLFACAGRIAPEIIEYLVSHQNQVHEIRYYLSLEKATSGGIIID